eukprot:scaffold1355_cov268-Pinguiococcus_pyrenoidosus.AAC.93
MRSRRHEERPHEERRQEERRQEARRQEARRSEAERYERMVVNQSEELFAFSRSATEVLVGDGQKLLAVGFVRVAGHATDARCISIADSRGWLLGTGSATSSDCFASFPAPCGSGSSVSANEGVPEGSSSGCLPICAVVSGFAAAALKRGRSSSCSGTSSGISRSLDGATPVLPDGSASSTEASRMVAEVPGAKVVLRRSSVPMVLTDSESSKSISSSALGWRLRSVAVPSALNAYMSLSPMVGPVDGSSGTPSFLKLRLRSLPSFWSCSFLISATAREGLAASGVPLASFPASTEAAPALLEISFACLCGPASRLSDLADRFEGSCAGAKEKLAEAVLRDGSANKKPQEEPQLASRAGIHCVRIVEPHLTRLPQRVVSATQVVRRQQHGQRPLGHGPLLRPAAGGSQHERDFVSAAAIEVFAIQLPDDRAQVKEARMLRCQRFFFGGLASGSGQVYRPVAGPRDEVGDVLVYRSVAEVGGAQQPDALQLDSLRDDEAKLQARRAGHLDLSPGRLGQLLRLVAAEIGIDGFRSDGLVALHPDDRRPRWVMAATHLRRRRRGLCRGNRQLHAVHSREPERPRSPVACRRSPSLLDVFVGAPSTFPAFLGRTFLLAADRRLCRVDLFHPLPTALNHADTSGAVVESFQLHLSLAPCLRRFLQLGVFDVADLLTSPRRRELSLPFVGRRQDALGLLHPIPLLDRQVELLHHGVHGPLLRRQRTSNLSLYLIPMPLQRLIQQRLQQLHRLVRQAPVSSVLDLQLGVQRAHQVLLLLLLLLHPQDDVLLIRHLLQELLLDHHVPRRLRRRRPSSFPRLRALGPSSPVGGAPAIARFSAKRRLSRRQRGKQAPLPGF